MSAAFGNIRFSRLINVEVSRKILIGPVDGKGEAMSKQPGSDKEEEEKDRLRRGSVLLAPWLDHKGGLNLRLWQGLVQRVMSIVISTPGKVLYKVAMLVSRTPTSLKHSCT